MGQSEAKERLEHISIQLQHTRTKEQVRATSHAEDRMTYVWIILHLLVHICNVPFLRWMK